MYAKKEKIYPAYVSKHNSNREKLVGFSALLKGITPKHKGYFYCLNYLHFFRTKNKLESRKRVCQNRDFYNVFLMPLRH